MPDPIHEIETNLVDVSVGEIEARLQRLGAGLTAARRIIRDQGYHPIAEPIPALDTDVVIPLDAVAHSEQPTLKTMLDYLGLQLLHTTDELIGQRGSSPIRRSIRIRIDDGVPYLTVKSRRNDRDQNVEQRTEYEVQLIDRSPIERFLQQIGFRAEHFIEKFRTSYAFEEYTIDIDEGHQGVVWVQLEGPSETALRSLVDRLGYNWSQTFIGSQRKVYERAGVDMDVSLSKPV